MIENHIIQTQDMSEGLRRRAWELGLEVSRRTVQRIRGGEIGVVGVVSGVRRERSSEEGRGAREDRGEGPLLMLGERERSEIEAILRRAAKASYLEFEGIKLESRPGEIAIRGLVYEPEKEYE